MPISRVPIPKDGAQEYAFLTSTKVVLKQLVYGPHFRKHEVRVYILLLRKIYNKIFIQKCPMPKRFSRR